MSDGLGDAVYEPSADDADVIDDDVVFGDDEVEEVLGTSYSPPERPRGLDAFGTTAAEQQRGETLDQRLAQEVPDGPLDDDEIDEQGEIEEVGSRRSGRLVEPDEGVHADTEKDLVAFDVGIDAGAASAEEAAMHVIDDFG